MPQNLDTKRIGIFLAFAFGIAWAGALAIYLLGGLGASSTATGQGLPIQTYILLVVYMGAPAMAHILTRLVTHEGWKGLYLRPNFRKGWLFWLVCWIAPGLLVIAGTAIFFTLFPQYYDPNLGALTKLIQDSLAKYGQAMPAGFTPWSIVIAQAIQAILIAPLLNALPTLGEEFGWRAYLQPRLMPLGGRKAILTMGLIWGVWHWPVIAMGHNYGLNYPGAPWLGMLAMIWFTLLLGTLLGWASLRARSVWPAVIGHGAVNGIVGISALFVQGEPNPLLGPMAVGVIGSLGLAVAALIIFLAPGALNPPEEESPTNAQANITIDIPGNSN